MHTIQHQESPKRGIRTAFCGTILSTLIACSHQVHQNIPIENKSTPLSQPSAQTLASNTFSKKEVTEMQKQLNTIFQFENGDIKVDGIYGNQTRKYITEFQNTCMKITQGYTPGYPDANTRAELSHHAKQRHIPENCGQIYLRVGSASNPGILRNFTQNMQQIGCPVIAQKGEVLTTFGPPHVRAIQRLGQFINGLPKETEYGYIEIAQYTYDRIQKLANEGKKFPNCTPHE